MITKKIQLIKIADQQEYRKHPRDIHNFFYEILDEEQSSSKRRIKFSILSLHNN